MNQSKVEATHRAEGAVLHLLLDAPRANILDDALLRGLSGALERHLRPDVKVVVFEGVGPNFSCGASVAEHRAEQAPAMLARFHGLFRQLAAQAVPTAALVRGYCLGGGLELASWCTWVVATPDASFGQPEIKLGVFPPMASLLLPWRVGAGPALDLCVSGRTIGAIEAHRLGLVSAVAEDPSAWWQAFFAEHIAATSAAALRFAERAARVGLQATLDAHLPALERMYCDELMKTHDANEGIAAFLEKRPARFLDR